MTSRSEIRRLAVQKPDALVAKIEQLEAQLEKAQIALAEMPCACPGQPGVVCAKCRYVVERSGSDKG